MTMFVLLSGSLHRDPAARQSKAGRQNVAALVKAGTSTEALWANVIAFDTAAQSQSVATVEKQRQPIVSSNHKMYVA